MVNERIHECYQQKKTFFLLYFFSRKMRIQPDELLNYLHRIRYRYRQQTNLKWWSESNFPGKFRDTNRESIKIDLHFNIFRCELSKTSIIFFFNSALRRFPHFLLSNNFFRLLFSQTIYCQTLMLSNIWEKNQFSFYRFC